MSQINISGDTSGSIALLAPLVAGTNTITLPATTGTLAMTSDVIGVGQTLQDVTGSRVSGTTYTNTTGKPISVYFSNGVASFTVNLNGSLLTTGTYASLTGSSGGTTNLLTYLVVPNSFP